MVKNGALICANSWDEWNEFLGDQDQSLVLENNQLNLSNQKAPVQNEKPKSSEKPDENQNPPQGSSLLPLPQPPIQPPTDQKDPGQIVSGPQPAPEENKKENEDLDMENNDDKSSDKWGTINGNKLLKNNQKCFHLAFGGERTISHKFISPLWKLNFYNS